MKKLTFLIALVLMFGTATISCKKKDKNVRVFDVSLSETAKTLNIGDTLQLTAIIVPTDATNKTVTWTSTVPTVATVLNGRVIAVATGTTAIIATTQDGGKTAICNITVSTGEPPTINVESIGLNKTTDTLQIGDSVQLTATILPTNATNQNITWVSTVPTVATVVNGKVKTLSVGTTSIIATTQDGGKTAICNITVVPVPTWCNDFRPEFGASLGTVEFLSSTVWTVGNQEWSDIVTASNCAKTTFNPSTYDSDLGHDSYNADCRADKPSGNYYYSWCAVHRFANVLCPSGWRVPTDADFAALDKVLKGSGNGTEHYTNPTIRDKYLADWGGKYTGHIEGDGELADSDFLAMYWSSVQASSNDANVLYYDATGLIYPQIPHGKGAGLVLRCVRNK